MEKIAHLSHSADNLSQLGRHRKYTLAALDRGAKPEEIKETLYQCAPYIGLETVHDALKEVNKAFDAAGISRPEVETRDRDRRNALCQRPRRSAGNFWKRKY